MSLLDTLHRRGSVLSLLVETPQRKRDIVADVEVSRSTVDRAIRDLEADGLVERTDGGYVATVAGRLTADARESYRRTVDGVDRSRPLLALLDRDVDVDRRMVAGATVVRATAPSQSAPLDRLRELSARSHRIRGVSAADSGTGFKRLFHERVVEGELDLEFVVTEAMADFLLERIVDDWAAIEEEGFQAYALEEIPYGLGVCEHDDGATAAVLVYDQQSQLAGILFNDDPDAVAWARSKYQRLRDGARRVEVPS